MEHQEEFVKKAVINDLLKNQIQKSIDLGKQWFLNSNIQELSEEAFTFGGISGWYDPHRKEFSPTYQEIVGYGISLNSFWYTYSKKDIYIQKALHAMKWLRKTEHPSGGHYFKYNQDEKEFMKAVYPFDTGMILNGLTNLYELTNDKTVLADAESAADWILKVQKEDGSLPAKHFVGEEHFISDGNKWSLQSGSFHGKVIIGLLHLHKITQNTIYKDAAIKLANFTLTFQEPNGRFITDNKENSTFLHPHCYTLEGLLAAGHYLNDEKYINAVKKGLEWSLNKQLVNGAFPFKYHESDLESDSPDFTAQVLRIYLFMQRLGYLNESESSVNLETLAYNLLSYQNGDKENPQAYGGFYAGNGWYVENEDPQNKKHVNFWVSAFILQALEMLINSEACSDPFLVV